MSDCFQTIADLDVDELAAQESADVIRSHLIAQGIIDARRTDCVLNESLGHAPGNSYHLAISEPDPQFVGLETNGVAFVAERSVFSSFGIDEISLICSACSRRFVGGDPWLAAIDDWFLSHGRGVLACPFCGAEASICDWLHEPPFAFGSLGITFWNWPPLRQEFIDDIAAVLGHRVRLVYGKV